MTLDASEEKILAVILSGIESVALLYLVWKLFETVKSKYFKNLLPDFMKVHKSH